MLTEFDVLVTIVVLLSSMIGFLRGIIKEAFSILGWFGAALITFFMFPYVAEIMDEYFKSIFIVNIVSIIVVFLVVLAVVSIFGALLLDNLREVRSGPIDRTFGTAFGLARGLLLVSALHFLVITLHNKEEPPKWLEEGETYKLTEWGGKKIHAKAKEYVDHLQVDEDDDEKSVTESVTEALKEKRTPKKIKLPERLPDADEEE